MGVQGIRQTVASWGDPIARIDAQVQTLMRPPAPVFTAATLLNGWQEYANGYAVAGWWTIGFEVVLQGAVDGGLGNIFATSIAPADGRKHRFYCDNGGGNAAEIDIDGAGNVVPVFGTNGFISLEGIRYIAT